MRRPFRFRPKTALVALDDDLDRLEEFVGPEERVFCIYGSSSQGRSGVRADVRRALGERPFEEFEGIRPNPEHTDIDRAAIRARAFGATCVLAAGGGSVMDAAKFVAVAALGGDDAWTIATRGKKNAPALPLFVVPTLPASGSESNAFAAISNGSTRQKIVYQNENIAPCAAFLVPKYTLTLPREERANGVVDAFVHVLETYLTYDVGATLHEELAEGVLRTLVRLGPLYFEQPDNLDAATEILLAAAYAQSGALQTGVPEDWSTHFVAHELTALFGLAHARTLAVVLPELVTLRLSRKAERLDRLGRLVFGLENPSPEASLAAIVGFFRRLGVESGLGVVPLDEAAITHIIDGLTRARRIRLGERLDIGLPELKSHLLRRLEELRNAQRPTS